MSVWETLLGMVILSATRGLVLEAIVLGVDSPGGWHRLYGYVVWGCDWPDGLWK